MSDTKKNHFNTDYQAANHSQRSQASNANLGYQDDSNSPRYHGNSVSPGYQPGYQANNAESMSEVNVELELAQRIIANTSCNLFLTGKAGTGKTTFLARLRKNCSKRMVVLAPTGIAAINAGGVTIHSFFQLDFAPYIPGMTLKRGSRHDRFSREKLSIIRAIDLLVIDEVSMVRADLMEQVDSVLRRHRDPHRPFGGVQLLMIGDLMQLAPVATNGEWDMLKDYYKSPYFFDSPALQDAGFEVIELQRVYRQSDTKFIRLLNAIRSGNVTDQDLAELNQRWTSNFVPPKDKSYVRLTTHNALARTINDQQMELLPSQPFTYNARVEGNFGETSYPADSALELKVGAQVMFIKNDSSGERHFYNGMLGTVTSLTKNAIVVKPAGEGKEPFYVKPEEWVNNRYEINHETNEITEVVDGKFLQYPLRPAWAITIHKSQGLTFDNAIIDASRSFAHGQAYVALSRCRTLEGMVLDQPLSHASVIADRTVQEFVNSHKPIDNSTLAKLMRQYRGELLCDLFSFEALNDAMGKLRHTVERDLTKVSNSLIPEYHNEAERFFKEVLEVAGRFRPQCQQLSDTDNVEMLNERVSAASRYFLNALQPIAKILEMTPSDHTNKVVKKRLTEQKAELTRLLTVKNALLITFMTEPFNPDKYLTVKGNVALSDSEKPKKAAKPKKAKTPIFHEDIDADEEAILARQAEEKMARAAARAERKAHEKKYKENPLFQRLVEWRRQVSVDKGLPAYVIARNSALEAICDTLPTTREALAATPYMIKTVVNAYGDTIISMVRESMED